MDLYTQGSGEILTVNSSDSATPLRSQSIESNYTPSRPRQARTPPYYRDNPQGQVDQLPRLTQRLQHPPAPTSHAAVQPVQPVQAVFLLEIPRKILNFYDQLSDTQLNQVRSSDPQLTDLDRAEITRRLALTDLQLQRYYEIPVAPKGTHSGAMVDFMNSLWYKVMMLFLP